MADRLMTQVSVWSFPRGITKTKSMTTWLPFDNRIKKGVVLSLKGEEGKWQIQAVYSTKNFADIDARGWDNNDYSKHEGLFK